MNPSYIAKNQDELFDKAPVDIQQLIEGGEVNNATAILGKVYDIPVSSYIALSNIISFILIGALKPEDVVTAIMDILKLPQDQAVKLATDLEKSILEKARVKILGKSSSGVVTLQFPGDGSKDELRKEILDTTKRESGFVKDQSTLPESPEQNTQPVATPGSHTQLLEQLQLIGKIPDDEEINSRLNSIKEQIASIESKSKSTLDTTNIPKANYMLGEKGTEVAPAEVKTSSYSKAPTKYNIDPYREIAEE